MDKYNLIDKFFKDPQDYIDFLVWKKLRIIANNDATCFAELKKEGECFLYTLTWLSNGKYIGDYIKPFRATSENIEIFNLGCKILADRLSIYLETNDINSVPTLPLAFGYLTHVKE